MKLKGKRSSIGDQYDSEIGCFVDNFMLQCKGGGGKQTTTTAPSYQQEQILQQQLGYANAMEDLGPQQYYGDDTVADMSDQTEAGLRAQEGAAGVAGDLSASAAQRFQDAMAYDPLKDPGTEEYLTAITNPLTRQFNEQTLPGLSSSAVKQGAFGGDRADILAQGAARDYMSEMGDTRTKALQGIVGQNRENQLGMLQQLGSLQEGALTPSQILQDVGAGREGYAQADIDAAMDRFGFEEDADRQVLRDASSMLGGINFGDITTTKGGGK